MKGLYFFIVFFFFTLSPPETSEVREAYRHAASSQEKAEQLYKNLEAITESDNALLLGYKGAAATILAKYAKSAKAKTGLFKEGKKLIEQAITANPENIELRYIRLSVQENAPKIVRYNKEISEDKQFILDHYSAIKNAEIKKYIQGFVSQSTSFSTAEKQLF